MTDLQTRGGGWAGFMVY